MASGTRSGSGLSRWMGGIAIGCALLRADAAAAGSGSARFVDDDAAPGGDGLAWGSAYRFLQSALAEAAASSGAVTEIRLAQGVYRPDRDETTPGGTGDRGATFQLINALALRGGYAGPGAPDPDLRQPEVYQSVLSGDLDSDDGPGFANIGENAWHVVTGTGADATAILDGLVITAGNADASSPINEGGGLYCGIFSAPTVVECTFSANSAAVAGGAMSGVFCHPSLVACTFVGNRSDDVGGAVAGFVHSEIALTGCLFQANVAFQGGALYNNESDPLIDTCTFVANSATGAGAILNHVGSDPLLIDCVLDGNFAESGAGAKMNDSGSPVIVGCTFAGNHTNGGNGGGLLSIGGSLTVIGSTFEANHAWFGNAILLTGTSTVVIGSTFLRNSPTGGWQYTWGGAMQITSSAPLLVNCAFLGNSSNYGGAINNLFIADPMLVNCILVGNFAERAAAFGGGQGAPSLVNCTIADNVATLAPGALELAFSDATLANCVVAGNQPGQLDDALITFSCVEGGFAGAGNIAGPPLFVRNPDPGPDRAWGTEDDDYGDLRLDGGSPCIDAGDNGAVPEDAQDLDGDGDEVEPLPVDAAGNARFVDDPEIVDTGWGTPPLVDMGALERQPPCPADVDGDGIVGINDFLDLLAAWGPNPGHPADIDQDGSVGITDFLALLSAWGPCG